METDDGSDPYDELEAESPLVHEVTTLGSRSVNECLKICTELCFFFFHVAQPETQLISNAQLFLLGAAHQRSTRLAETFRTTNTHLKKLFHLTSVSWGEGISRLNVHRLNPAIVCVCV